jgi:hypothetical protein
VLEVGRFAGGKAPIVDKAATSERLRKDTLLFVGRIKPILIRPLCLAHSLLSFPLLFLDMFFNCCQDFPVQGSIVLFGNLPYLFQQLLREPDVERFDIVFHVASIALFWLHVKQGVFSTIVPAVAANSQLQKEAPFTPIAEARGPLALWDRLS